MAVKQLSQEQVQTIKGYCAGYKRHPFNMSLLANSNYAFQAPFVRTDVLSSQHRSYDNWKVLSKKEVYGLFAQRWYKSILLVLLAEYHFYSRRISSRSQLEGAGVTLPAARRRACSMCPSSNSAAAIRWTLMGVSLFSRVCMHAQATCA
jgi:hypothetical protein